MGKLKTLQIEDYHELYFTTESNTNIQEKFSSLTTALKLLEYKLYGSSTFSTVNEKTSLNFSSNEKHIHIEFKSYNYVVRSALFEVREYFTLTNTDYFEGKEYELICNKIDEILQTL